MLSTAPALAPAAAPPITSAGPLACRVRLTPGPIAAAQARRQVSLALAAWNVPVDADIAVLLTSDLVTHAIRHAPGGAVTLGVRCTRTRLTVDVHDSASPGFAQPGVQAGHAGQAGQPEQAGQAGARVSPTLALVARLSAGWGCAETPAGQAAYFTLAVAGG